MASLHSSFDAAQDTISRLRFIDNIHSRWPIIDGDVNCLGYARSLMQQIALIDPSFMPILCHTYDPESGKPGFQTFQVADPTTITEDSVRTAHLNNTVQIVDGKRVLGAPGTLSYKLTADDSKLIKGEVGRKKPFMINLRSLEGYNSSLVKVMYCIPGMEQCLADPTLRVSSLHSAMQDLAQEKDVVIHNEEL